VQASCLQEEREEESSPNGIPLGDDEKDKEKGRLGGTVNANSRPEFEDEDEDEDEEGSAAAEADGSLPAGRLRSRTVVERRGGPTCLGHRKGAHTGAPLRSCPGSDPHLWRPLSRDSTPAPKFHRILLARLRPRAELVVGQ